MRAALNEEFLYRRGDLGRDGCLGERRKRGVGGDLLGDGALFRMDRLNVNLSGGCLRRLAAGDREQRRQGCQKGNKKPVKTGWENGSKNATEPGAPV